MNILEELKVKPSVKKHDLINVKLNFNLIDDRDIGYDRDILDKKISKNKISKIEKLLHFFSEDVEPPKKASKKITTKIGQAKREMGLSKDNKPRPLPNQITISLSVYMRDKVATEAMYKAMVTIVCILPSTV